MKMRVNKLGRVSKNFLSFSYSKWILYIKKYFVLFMESFVFWGVCFLVFVGIIGISVW